MMWLLWVERIYEYDATLAWGENDENKTQKEKKGWTWNKSH
jgi:hypothetical protein